MLEQVWSRVSASTRIDRVIVATDDPRIFATCEQIGAEGMMTDSDHPSGTDRVAEVCRRVGEEYGIVANIQGDEPLITPSCLDRLVEAFDNQEVAMATLSEPIQSREELLDPNVVKVVVAGDGRALYFSRSPIPYYRSSTSDDLASGLASRSDGLAGYRKHQGIYGYRRDILNRLSGMQPTPLELDESLEQLRALESGISIAVVESDFRSQAVDTPADLERVEKMLTEAH